MKTFDARAWVVWVIAAAVIIMTTRNPLYSVMLLLIIRIVHKVCALPGTGTEIPLLRIGVAILIFTTLFNGLTLHIGNTVLFAFPLSWPWVGGPITLEAAVFGMNTGFVLLNLLMIFSAFNEVVSINDLVRLMPRALQDLGVVLLIGITYIPETTRQLKRIREAQAIRGHHLRGIRDWRPIVIPLLIGSLERAMGLAEAMVSRGYGATVNTHQPLAIQFGLAFGLLAALSGWVLTFWSSWLGWALLATGVVLILWLTFKLSRRSPYTRYRSRKWTKKETILVAGSILPLLFLFLPLLFVDRTTLIYQPIPSLKIPGFDLFIGLSLTGLLMPALIAQME